MTTILYLIFNSIFILKFNFYERMPCTSCMVDYSRSKKEVFFLILIY